MNLTTSLATLTILRSSKSCVDSVTYDPWPSSRGSPPLDDELLPTQIPEEILLSNQVGTRSYAIRQLVGPKDQDRIS